MQDFLDPLELVGPTIAVSRGRFHDRVGQTPIGYLTKWRMMAAGDKLKEGQDSLATVASALGYQSDNAFKTAFRRVMGCSPRRYVRETSRHSQ